MKYPYTYLALILLDPAYGCLLQKSKDFEFKPLKTLSKYKLCSYDFEKCRFTNQLTKNRLTLDAIPTITTRMPSDDHLFKTQNGAGKHFCVINFEFNPLLTYALEIFVYFAWDR